MRRACACDVDSGGSYLYCSVYSLDDLFPTRYGACDILGNPRALDVHDDARDVQNSADDLDGFENKSYFRVYDGTYSIPDARMGGGDGNHKVESTA